MFRFLEEIEKAIEKAIEKTIERENTKVIIHTNLLCTQLTLNYKTRTYFETNCINLNVRTTRLNQTQVLNKSD